MENKKYQLILGSKSPRRKELLRYTYLPFTCETCDIEEVSEEENETDFVMDISQKKSEAVLETINNKYENPLVLGADTIVCLNGDILGKPKDVEEAKSMLLSLSGGVHDVYTGVTLMSNKKQLSFYEKTQVEFEHITEDLLAHYLATNESLDKAGAYGIQAYSLGFVAGVKGSYSNVVGLPVNLVLKKIKDFLDCSNDEDGQWRSKFE